MLSCILRSPLQVAFSQAVRHDLSGGLLTCLVVLGQKCTIVCTGAEGSSLWRRCRLWRRFPLCFRQMQQGCRCDDLSLSLNVCPFNVLMTWYILYLYYFTLNKSCLSLSLSLNVSKFLGQKMSRPEGDSNPNLRIHAECSNHLSYRGQTFATPCFGGILQRMYHYVLRIVKWFQPKFTGQMITYNYWDWSYFMVVKGPLAINHSKPYGHINSTLVFWYSWITTTLSKQGHNIIEHGTTIFHLNLGSCIMYHTSQHMHMVRRDVFCQC